MSTDRTELRRRLRARRQRFARWHQRSASRRIAARLQRERRWLRSRTVAAYLPGDGEPDPRAALGARDSYFPVLTTRSTGLARARGLRPDRHGLLTPERGRRLTRPMRLQCILVPLVGFDRSGTRLGRGQGYYDRLLSENPHTLRIGIAWACQQCPRLPAEPWDMPMDWILTERKLHRLTRHGRSVAAPLAVNPVI